MLDFVILLALIFLFVYFYHRRENFEYGCEIYGNDYNACYFNSNCSIGFLPDGSTHCMKKFLYEDI